MWVWQRGGGGRLNLTSLGPRKLGTFLLTDPTSVRSQPLAYQQALSEHLHAQFLQALLHRMAVSVVLDVGANHGQFGRLLRRLGYPGRIVSYEPVSTNLVELRKAASGDPDWLVEDFALGEVDGTAQINVSAGPGRMSSLLPSSAFGRERFVNLRDEVMTSETIRVRRLDGVYGRAVAGIERPRVFLKLDTQGYDLLALSGAGEHTGEVVGLQSEVSCIPVYLGMPHLTEQITAYEEAGFAVAGMFPVTRDHKTSALVEADLVLVRRERLD